jgi:hypothetical protein
MYDALWNPVLFVIYISEQREIGLGLNTHIFEFDCFFAHEATFNGRSAAGLGVFSLTTGSGKLTTVDSFIPWERASNQRSVGVRYVVELSFGDSHVG